MAIRDVVEINGDLVAIAGVVGPSSFFENLRPVDSNDRTVFLNDVGKSYFSQTPDHHALQSPMAETFRALSVTAQ